MGPFQRQAVSRVPLLRVLKQALTQLLLTSGLSEHHLLIIKVKELLTRVRTRVSEHGRPFLSPSTLLTGV